MKKSITLFCENGYKLETTGSYFTVKTGEGSIELCAHKSLHNLGTYDVTDPKTGFSVGKEYFSMKDAKHGASEKIKRVGLAGYNAAVEKAMKFIEKLDTQSQTAKE